MRPRAHPTADASPSAPRAVLLDRDGTVIQDRHYAFRPDDIELLDGAIAGLRSLQAAGYRLYVITNQSGVARGYFSESDVRAMHDRLDAILREADVHISGYYYCPHHPEGVVEGYSKVCECRKPRPGLIHRVSADDGIDLRHSWVVGNAPSDVQAGEAAGCRTVLLVPDNADQPSPTPVPRARIARTLREAARIIRAHDWRHRPPAADDVAAPSPAPARASPRGAPARSVQSRREPRRRVSVDR